MCDVKLIENVRVNHAQRHEQQAYDSYTYPSPHSRSLCSQGYSSTTCPSRPPPSYRYRRSHTLYSRKHRGLNTMIFNISIVILHRKQVDILGLILLKHFQIHPHPHPNEAPTKHPCFRNPSYYNIEYIVNLTTVLHVRGSANHPG